MKIYGIKEAKGNYQGADFHNVNLHCLDDDDNATGSVCCIVKCKVSKLCDIFGDDSITVDKLQSFIGSDISVYYDQYKNPAHVVVRK